VSVAKDPYRYFRVEARELLDGLGGAVLELEKSGSNEKLLGHLLRLAHTLKGAARVVKEPAIAEQAHIFEEILAPYRDGATPVPHDRVNQLLGRLDAISGRLVALEAPRSEPRPGPAEETFSTVRVEIAEMDALLHGLSEAAVQLTALRREVARLDRPNLNSGLDAVEGELAQVREAASRLRLVPAATIFPALERAARDASDALGKPTDLVTSGGEHRLEAHILARVRGALLHAVRNAVAHGIEPAARRAMLGKPPVGKVSIHVERRRHRLTFVCRDDGAGIDLEAARAAAVRHGRISAGDAAHLGSAELIPILLEPGMTTAAAPSHMAGRGVGLDVVCTTARQLKGEVGLTSEPNRGTSLEISVPVSLSVVRGLELHVGDTVAYVPIDAVLETLRLPTQAITRHATGESIAWQGTAIPFLPLADALDLEDASAHRGTWSAIVLQTPSGRVAVGVDRLAGTQDVVVSRLPALAPTAALVAGTTFDADGNPQIILDPEGLAAAAAVGRRRPEPSAAPPRRPAPILIVDDSLTTRMLEQNIIETAGYQVELATSAEEALVMARQRAYSLFLVDVEMPGMDGFELVERTQLDPGLRGTPAILITSRGAVEDRRRGARAGARGYMVKGEFDQGRLLEMIQGLIG